ncbi:hypothetical protein SAMN06297251_12014 [Fulvimarina manganoxydans]|uniref:Uncharacterized protein n=1 Tax=Fulvimarina manganoxydans TaxID=937218 RepID=A0A1W2E2H3_9HYPH|nr:hypothetical protein [Fulvimarina manganoxydans]SMD03687.1 hypothetical protein SAMN06297251_12014 [Fulvimarina manganoxydans]
MINRIDDSASDAMRFFLSQKTNLVPRRDAAGSATMSDQDEAVEHPAEAKDIQARTS